MYGFNILRKESIYIVLKKRVVQKNWSEFNGELVVALVAMLYVDILDTTGTLYGMAAFSGHIKDGNFKKSKQAFCSDAIGTVVGSMLGTTDVTAYIESAAGINEGGKTGITALVVEGHMEVW